jgi:hypothetical protein
LATKVEEYTPLSVEEVCELLGEDVTQEEVKEAEVKVLGLLNYEVYGVSAEDFLFFLDADKQPAAGLLMDAIHLSADAEILRR